MNLRFPDPRQQFVETVDGMSIDHAREHVVQVSVGFDAVEFAGFDQRTDDYPTISALPMSGRKWKFTTDGTRILAARSAFAAWSNG